MIYSGRVSPERGLETPLLSIIDIKKQIPEIILIILGDGP